MSEKLCHEFNTIKSEHLKPGVNPIMTCIGTYADFFDDFKQISALNTIFNDGKSSFVDYNAEANIQKEKQIKNAGDDTYAISKVDERNKFSNEYYDCTGLIVIGRDKTTNKEISLLTHQDPKKILVGNIHDYFVKDLRESLLEIKNQSEEGTIDAIIIGGNSSGRYSSSLDLIDKIVQDIFLFKPVIVGDKKNYPGWGYNGDKLFLETQNRRAYLIRPTSNDIGKNFIHSKN